VLQSPELQLEQEFPLVPAMLFGTPPRLALKAEKVDSLRRAGLWHLGHSAGCPDSLKGLICSNSELHSEQTYS
jgi:hypothetical protein